MLISSIGKYRYIKSSLKNGKTIFTEADLKKARKQMTRNIVAVTAANVMYAMVCQGVKLLLDQDDEEDNDGKNALEQMISQFVDTSFGMFPFVKEIESFFVHGYEVSEISTSSMNNVLSDIRNTYALGEKVVSGTATSQDVAKTVRQTIYDAGMVFGLPIRNTYNLAYGLTKRVSDTAAYEINSIFYEPKSSDITTAINKNDDRLARASLSGVMLTKGFDVSDEQASILLNGYKNGGNLPSGVPTKITVDGVEQELTKKERQIFESVYSKASTEVDKCIDKGLFKSLKTDEQVKVLNTIYKYYYDLAKMEALGLDASKLSLMGQAFNIGTFAKVITVCGTFTGDNRKEQITKYINSQNLTAAQKYMLMGYLGYKNTKGKAKVESYIKTLDLTKAEKEKLLGYSGY